MAQTGVLPFVRGIDFTKYNFDEELKHPKLLSEMQRLRWIRINNAGMKSLPDEITSLKKLVKRLFLTNTNFSEKFFNSTFHQAISFLVLLTLLGLRESGNCEILRGL